MSKETFLVGALGLALGAAVFAACSSDDTAVTPVDGGVKDSTTGDSTTGEDAAADAVTDGGTEAETGTNPVLRGKYIVDVLANCGDCHTPRMQDGTPDMTRYLAGVDCFIGSDLNGDGGADAATEAGADAGPGCLNSRNLTNDPTGLKNRTDQQILDMILNGVRPNGEFLHPFMPYWQFHNMRDDDANAVVHYLRTVPAVEHQVAANQPPWNIVPAAAIPINIATVPAVPEDAGDSESARRGRYLASTLAGCIDCHTPETSPGSGQLDYSKFFTGNRAFPAALLGLPVPPFPSVIFSPNLTQDSTGLAGYTVQDIVRELKEGKDRDGGGICPPMPAGAMGGFGQMTDDDARDIANYILTLPPVSSPHAGECVAP